MGYLNKELEHHEKKFVGWFIPAEVVYLFEDEVITMSEMILLATIDSLIERKKNGTVIGCFASNQWLANKLNLKNPKSISNMIAKLTKLGFITENSFDGRRRYLLTRYGKRKMSRHL